MTDNDIGNTIKDAFDYVLTVYKETSFFLQDLEKELIGLDFYSVNGRNQTGASLSYLFEYPNFWLTRYLTRFWVLKQAAESWKGRRVPFLSCSAIFVKNGQAIAPLLTYGLFQSMDAEEATYNFDWHIKVINNEGGYFTYYKDNKATNFEDIKFDRKATAFKCELSDLSYAWPKQGVLIALPLTEIKDSQDIIILANEMKGLWEKRSSNFQF